MSKRAWQYAAGGLVLLFLVLQMVPGAVDNPPVEEELQVPSEVAEVLQRSCYDCHSNQTDWPWYAYVAPTKWLVTDHVADARDELNFTAWNRINAGDRAHKFEEIAEEVEEEHMPLRSYLLIHRDARLADAERALLIEWATGEALALEAADGAGAEETAGSSEDADR